MYPTVPIDTGAVAAGARVSARSRTMSCWRPVALHRMTSGNDGDDVTCRTACSNFCGEIGRATLLERSRISRYRYR